MSTHISACMSTNTEARACLHISAHTSVRVSTTMPSEMTARMSTNMSFTNDCTHIYTQVVLVILCVLHFVFLPYAYGSLDKLDCFYLLSLMIFALTGMTFSLYPVCV